MDTGTATLVSAIIQAVGTIIAALIAALAARRIIKDVRPLFHSYSDPSHDLRDITQKAESDVFIIAAVGDRLLGKYQSEFERLLQNGIRIRYLLLDTQRFHELERYMHGHPVSEEIYHNVLNTLSHLHEKYPHHFYARIFHDLMPASYIGVDVWPNPLLSFSFLPSSVIQTMLYQYHIPAEDLPITYLSPKTNKQHFKATVSSMKEMWVSATPLSNP